MRSVLLAVAILLSGCASADDATVEDEPVLDAAPPELVLTRMDLSAGTGKWHDPERDPLDAYDLASQPVAHPCVWDGGAYFNNMLLGGSGLRDPVPNGTRSLVVTFSWGIEDSHRESLVLGYRPAGHDTVYETQHIRNGEETELQVEPSTKPGMWTFWACMTNAQDTDFIDAQGPRSFWGELTWDIDALAMLPTA